MKIKFRSIISRVVLITLMGVFSIGLVSTQSTNALGVGSMSILPVNNEQGNRSWFVHVLAEGEETRDEMVITNDKDESITVLIFPTGYTTSKNEIIKDEIKDVLHQEPGHWVELDQTEITIPSNSSRKVGFTISVPESADVGEHVGGIFIQEKSKEGVNKATGVNLKLHIGARMVINVPGDIERYLNVSNIRHRVDYADNRALNFIFALENQGNVALAPVLDTKMRGFFGSVGEQTGSQLRVISRNEVADTESKWIKRAPYIGRFVANFEFHTGEREQFNKDGTKTLLPDEIIEATYTFWLFPWAELIYILIGIFIIYSLRSLWLYLIISRRLRTKSKLYKATKGDTLTGIAAKFGADPRVLAKFNMMRWPYEVKPGDKLLIPVGRMKHDEWREQSKTMLGNREIMGGIFGHLFRRRNPHHMSNRLMGHDGVQKLDDNMEILVAEKGDTIADVASFAGIEIQTLIDMNNLRPPYRLRVGQELIVPKKKPRKSKNKKKDKDE